MIECNCGKKLPEGRRVCDECQKDKRKISSIAWYKRNRWKIMQKKKSKRKEGENGKG
jgi:hypothetical protein